jgi:hypothetical protein
VAAACVETGISGLPAETGSEVVALATRFRVVLEIVRTVGTSSATAFFRRGGGL